MNYSTFMARFLFHVLILFFPLVLAAQDTIVERPRVYANLNRAIADGDQVKILKLTNKKLKEIPPEVFLLKNLEILDLSSNKIKNVPADIGKLVNLRELNLSRNKIKKLPADIGKLNNLEKLSINRNPIDSLPDEISKLQNLQVLDMWSTELAILPESIKQLENLKIIELRGILFNQEQQDYMQSLLPEATINFSPPCTCKF